MIDGWNGNVTEGCVSCGAARGHADWCIHYRIVTFAETEPELWEIFKIENATELQQLSRLLNRASDPTPSVQQETKP